MITHPACEPQTCPEEGRPRACAEVALACAVGEEVDAQGSSFTATLNRALTTGFTDRRAACD